MDQIIPMVYLARRGKYVMDNVELNVMMRQESIVYRTPFTREAHRANNDGFWMVIRKLTIGWPVWAYTRIFECARYGQGSWKATKGHFEGKPPMIRENKTHTWP